jgi:pilus assembly protein Flp/PilA
MLNRIIVALQAKKLAKKSQKGATAVEYGLLAALIAVVIIASVTLLGEELEKTFQNITSAMTAANNR